MAVSKCLGCGHQGFELIENQPANSKWKYLFVQCASCGGVVGVVDWYNVGALLVKAMKKLGIDV